MAKDFLNIIERALMIGISDQLNSATAAGDDIYVFGQFPDSEELKFPAVVVQLVNSGFEENFFGNSVTFGSTSNNTSSGDGEVYGVTFLFHIFVDKDTELSITSTPNKSGSSATIVYKQRRLINWLMLNIANAVMSINWDDYEEDELEILERHLEQWRDIGFMPQAQWYGATAEFTLAFLNLR
tara:strand:- start:22 stop:570 length:549 start_codon:yes stop_codon:yes gene_type:complete